MCRTYPINSKFLQPGKTNMQETSAQHHNYEFANWNHNCRPRKLKKPEGREEKTRRTRRKNPKDEKKKPEEREEKTRRTRRKNPKDEKKKPEEREEKTRRTRGREEKTRRAR